MTFENESSLTTRPSPSRDKKLGTRGCSKQTQNNVREKHLLLFAEDEGFWFYIQQRLQIKKDIEKIQIKLN